MNKINFLIIFSIFSLFTFGCAGGAAVKTGNAVVSSGGAVVLISGENHSLAVRVDGTVAAWGKNDFGQLGNGTHTDKSTPVTASELAGIINAAAGANHSLALRADGTVWAWGDNQYGQLGLGSKLKATARPLKIEQLSGIVAISAGKNRSMALDNTGQVYGWGQSHIVDRDAPGKAIPVKFEALYEITAFADGNDHSIAIKQDGSVVAWGGNWAGQLGNGTTEDDPYPVTISGLSDVKQVVAGGYHSLVLKNNGTVWAVGLNENGQLGNNGTQNSLKLLQVEGLFGIVAIAGGEEHSLAVTKNGTVYAWGWNEFGQLGNGDKGKSNFKISKVVELQNIVDIAAGSNHSVSMDNRGKVWAWGNNNHGQLGNGIYIDGFHPDPGSSVPVSVKQF